METVNISVDNAIKAFEKADKQGKDLLLNLIGKEVLQRNITDRIKTVEDILTVANSFGFITEDMWLFLNYKGCDKEVLASSAHMKLTLLAKILNQGWEPNWDNSNEYKWYPYFDMRAGVGFSSADCGCWYPGTCVGSRLCFKSKELAMYAGTQFVELYKILFKK